MTANIFVLLEVTVTPGQASLHRRKQQFFKFLLFL